MRCALACACACVARALVLSPSRPRPLVVRRSIFDDDAAPAAVRVKFTTTAGDFRVTVDPALSPIGVGQFLALVNEEYFAGAPLWRVVPGALVQFGYAVDPAATARWDPSRGAPMPPLPDEPNGAPFRSGTLSYAGDGPNSRCCHFFFALDPVGSTLGDAPHETTLGWADDAAVLERVVANYEAAGYVGAVDGRALAAELAAVGGEAADAYPALDRILACAVE